MTAWIALEGIMEELSPGERPWVSTHRVKLVQGLPGTTAALNLGSARGEQAPQCPLQFQTKAEQKEHQLSTTKNTSNYLALSLSWAALFSVNVPLLDFSFIKMASKVSKKKKIVPSWIIIGRFKWNTTTYITHSVSTIISCCVSLGKATKLSRSQLPTYNIGIIIASTS